ncbi:Hypothetical predicted protein [Paramuricea clavata]|uniref:Uncharacterized protein n=1 Tax=Paramuricea clavata TaxID=317549 RepID=A0A6S7G290_PARCT|nr:Hypothetical predicted protein [Paramuricea clavata]
MGSNNFTRFVDYLGFNLNDTNYTAYQDLYRNFEQFCLGNTSSFELQFIRWHQQYTCTPPQTPPTGVVIPTPQPPSPLPDLSLLPDPLHLPIKLATLPGAECFNTFTLENRTQPTSETSTTTTTMPAPTTETTNNTLEQALFETLDSAELQTMNDNIGNIPPNLEQVDISDLISPRPAPKLGLGVGKNIEKLKDDYAAKTPKRKRSKSGVRGSGRPTNDISTMRMNDESEDQKNNAALALREVQLLTSGGEIRKKCPIYTRHPYDIKCFAIGHYSSFEMVAEKRKKALEKIKKHRETLSKLNYIESNLLPLVEKNNTL